MMNTINTINKRTIAVDVTELQKRIVQLEKFIQIEKCPEKKTLLTGMAGICVVLLSACEKTTH